MNVDHHSTGVFFFLRQLKIEFGQRENRNWTENRRVIHINALILDIFNIDE